MASSALEEAGVPYYRRFEGGGVERAMPAIPAEIPGVFWCVYVPSEVSSKAKRLLNTLPVNNFIGGYSETPEDVRNHRIIIGVLIAIVLLFVFWQFVLER